MKKEVREKFDQQLAKAGLTEGFPASPRTYGPSNDSLCKVLRTKEDKEIFMCEIQAIYLRYKDS